MNQQVHAGPAVDQDRAHTLEICGRGQCEKCGLGVSRQTRGRAMAGVRGAQGARRFLGAGTGGEQIVEVVALEHRQAEPAAHLDRRLAVAMAQDDPLCGLALDGLPKPLAPGVMHDVPELAVPLQLYQIEPELVAIDQRK